MADISIRAACWDDWPVIADFNTRLAFESEQKRLDPDKIRPGVQALLQDPAKGRYFVAQDGAGGPVIGQIMHTYEWSDWRNGPIWWLQSVYIAAEHRQRGVFRALFEHLVQLAETENVLGVRLYVEQENVRAHLTYEKLGLKPAGYFVMERWFGPSL